MSAKRPKSTAPLPRILADTYLLAVKTHVAHWNVTGAGFFQLHAAFGSQYEALFEAADELAERLRATGKAAPDLQDFTEIGRVASRLGAHDGASLVRALRDDHRQLSSACQAGIAFHEAAGDHATADLLTGRVEEHDKTAWMLTAFLG